MTHTIRNSKAYLANDRQAEDFSFFAIAPIVSSRPISELPNSNYFNDSTAKLPTEFRRKYEQWQKMKSPQPPDPSLGKLLNF